MDAELPPFAPDFFGEASILPSSALFSNIFQKYRHGRKLLLFGSFRPFFWMVILAQSVYRGL